MISSSYPSNSTTVESKTVNLLLGQLKNSQSDSKWRVERHIYVNRLIIVWNYILRSIYSRASEGGTYQLQISEQQQSEHTRYIELWIYFSTCVGNTAVLCNHSFFLESTDIPLQRKTIFYTHDICLIGPGSSVGIATAYGLDGPGIEPDGGEIFRTCPDRP
jgi:hypothetical protein